MPSDSTSSATDRNARASERAAGAGVWPMAAMAVLSGALCLTWLMSADTAATAPEADATSSVSAITEVAASDLDAALATMDAPAGFLARFKADAQGCRWRLAQITLVGGTGEPGARVRLRSAAYHSPEFVLGPTPVRVAIPFPAPYHVGHGELEVLHVGAATVALLPPWHVSGPDGMARHQVAWQPGQDCERPNG